MENQNIKSLESLNNTGVSECWENTSYTVIIGRSDGSHTLVALLQNKKDLILQGLLA